jgi:hypothetical protein
MKCSSVFVAVTLLLLATAGPCAAGGRLKGYIINPASYLDVVPRPAITFKIEDFMSDPGAAQCTNSSSSASVPAADSAPPCAAHQEHKHSSSQSSSSIEDFTSAAAARGRMLLQGPANSARLQKPYRVCVSPWIPMVHCDPETDPAEWKGGSMASTQHS